MTATASVTIRIQVDGLPGGSLTRTPPSQEYAAAVGTRQTFDLANGDNTLAAPSGATGLLLIPPTSNTYAMIARTTGAAGTGMSIDKTAPAWLTLASGTSAVYVQAGGAVAGCELFWV